MQSTPSGTPRVAAISPDTFAAGSTPPSPGLAPWLDLISRARTGAPATRSSSRCRSNLPCSSRQPKYAVPIWNTSSPPWRWWTDNPPSPVFCRQPASAAPPSSASTAAPDGEPKLIAEMLTTEAGRNLAVRRRAAPSTLALGSSTSLCAAMCEGGDARPRVRCLMTG
jgi:hypothetical protein